jgi:hypothetical protein
MTDCGYPLVDLALHPIGNNVVVDPVGAQPDKDARSNACSCRKADRAADRRHDHDRAGGAAGQDGLAGGLALMDVVADTDSRDAPTDDRDLAAESPTDRRRFRVQISRAHRFA